MSQMRPGMMPKPSEHAKAAFTKLVPDEPAVNMRPMFGNLAAFVNGNMFTGLFGEDLFVRLPDVQERAGQRRPAVGVENTSADDQPVARFIRRGERDPGRRAW